MKKLFLLALIALSAITISSCKKSNQVSVTPTTVIVNSDLSANDTLKNISAEIQNGAGGQKELVIAGESSYGKYNMWLDFYLHQFGETATISVSSSNYADFKLQESNLIYECSNAKLGSAGTFTITKNDTTAKRIEGSFYGTAVNDVSAGDKVTVISGAFKVSY